MYHINATQHTALIILIQCMYTLSSFRWNCIGRSTFSIAHRRYMVHGSLGWADELPDLVTWLPLYVSPYVIMCLGMSSYVLLGLWTSIYVLLRTSPHVIMCLRTSSNVSMCLTASSYVLIGLRTSLYTLQCLRMSEYKHSRGEIHRILMIDYTFCWLV